MRNYGILLLVCFLVSLLGCAQDQEDRTGRATDATMKEMKKDAESAAAVIFGIVRQSPAKGMPPRTIAGKGHPVPGATVALYELVSAEEPAGPVAATMVTDSTGAYRIEADRGAYILTVTGAKIPRPIFTTGLKGKTFSAADSIQFARLIKMGPGEQEQEIVLPQNWPE